MLPTGLTIPVNARSHAPHSPLPSNACLWAAGIDGNPLAVLVKQMQLHLADIRSGELRRSWRAWMWVVARSRQGVGTRSCCSSSQRRCPPRPLYCSCTAETPLYLSDGTEPAKELDDAVEQLHNGG